MRGNVEWGDGTQMAAPLMAVIIPSGWFHSGLQPSATSWSALINEGCNLSRHTNTQVHTYTCTYIHLLEGLRKSILPVWWDVLSITEISMSFPVCFSCWVFVVNAGSVWVKQSIFLLYHSLVPLYWCWRVFSDLFCRLSRYASFYRFVHKQIQKWNEWLAEFATMY